MSRLVFAVVACFTFGAMAPSWAQVVPRLTPAVPVVPVVPVMPVVPTPLPIPLSVRVPTHVRTPPFQQPPIPSLDANRGGSSPTPTTTPAVDLRGTLPNTGGTPTVRENAAEPSDVDFNAPRRISEPATTYADPEAEARDAQARGVALHLGGQPPPNDKDDDEDDQEEGSNWWLWVLLVIGVLVVSSWMRKGK